MSCEFKAGDKVKRLYKDYNGCEAGKIYTVGYRNKYNVALEEVGGVFDANKFVLFNGNVEQPVDNVIAVNAVFECKDQTEQVLLQLCLFELGYEWAGSGKTIIDDIFADKIYINVEEKVMYMSVFEYEKKNYLKHTFVFGKIDFNIEQVPYKETVNINGVEYDKQEYLAAIAKLTPISRN